MTPDDVATLRRAAEQLAPSDVDAALARATATGAARATRRRLLGVACVAVPLTAVVIAWAITTSPATRTRHVIAGQPAVQSVGCPGQYDPRTRPRDPGLADTLPEEGAAVPERMTPRLAQVEENLRRGHGATRVTIGPGWGLAYRMTAQGPKIVDEVDSAFVAHLPSDAFCPRNAEFDFNDHGERVPIIYVIDTPTAP